MSDATVEFLLNVLQQQLDYHLHLIKDTPDRIKNLQRDLRKFNAFLWDSVEKRRNDDRQTKETVRLIREVVYEMEDVIDAFVNKIMDRSSSTFLRYLKLPASLHAIGKKVEGVVASVEKARAEIGIGSRDNEDDRKPLTSEDRPPRKIDVVGFEDEARWLVERLKRESQYFDVISITGVLGLGKTTLAWKVFNDQDIIDNFDICIWVRVSENFSAKDIFVDILRQLTVVDKAILGLEDEKLAELINARLKKKSFLIVMDDVWEIRHWNKLLRALPRENNKGKVLITSRNADVGKYACHPNPIKKLRSFDDDESWDLLQLEAVRKPVCPVPLVEPGKTIASKCEGLPLVIVLIGGILATKYEDSNITATRKEWEKVSNGASNFLWVNDQDKSMKKFICLSYDRLPQHLRACFLYFGMLPEKFEIRASKLIRMWIAEGFIPQVEGYTLEETAEGYLKELVNRNLVQVGKFKYTGKIKTCRILDTLRDFCREEAASESFVKEIKCADGKFSPAVAEIGDYRRLSIHSDCLDFISLRPSCPRVRTFVSLSNNVFTLSEKLSKQIFAAFEYVKVFDVEPWKFSKIDSKMYRLVYMRYMALSCNLSILPPKFSRFRNLQTLIIHTTSPTLEVKDDIWNMSELRYFKTNASATLPKPSKSSQHGKELQTLGTISVESCTTEVLNQASNVKKLGIRGNLNLFFDGTNGSFDCLREMKRIEKLILINDLHPNPPKEGKVHRLPQPDQFPATLTSLTLRATFLRWDAMPILGSLPKLEVLKIKDNAFVGSNWKAVDGGFQSLEILHIKKTDLIRWKAESHHYPKLRALVLRYCENLSGIPIGLAKIESLQILELFECRSAAASAKKIMEAKKKTQAEGSTFTLSIFPRE